MKLGKVRCLTKLLLKVLNKIKYETNRDKSLNFCKVK